MLPPPSSLVGHSIRQPEELKLIREAVKAIEKLCPTPWVATPLRQCVANDAEFLWKRIIRKQLGVI